MKKFILITGPMGVGKTVTGKLLCDRIGRAAFIDGDWCLDIHPFVGNKETISMALNNIIYLTKNYYYCSECDTIVLSWVISENNIEKIASALSDFDIKIYSITLICDTGALVNRWHKDETTEWRTDEWLENSIKSIENYRNRKNTNVIDTSRMIVSTIVDEIVKKLL